MNVNKQAFALRGVTVEDYIAWCNKKNRKKSYSSNKKEFFSRLDDGRLVKDPRTGELKEKRPRRRD